MRRRSWGLQLQRFFSTFPDKGPGVGLLILRLLLGITTVVQIAGYLTELGRTPVAMSAGITALVAAALVVVGLFTPVSTTVAASFIVLANFGQHSAPLLLGKVPAVSMAVVAVAVILLGPGAISIDARWFGRREIVFNDK
jgi:uncharacterized membrane protein YphA (DoxX/SURF4 family)